MKKRPGNWSLPRFSIAINPISVTLSLFLFVAHDSAEAGPNTGGTLVLHANPALAYSAGTSYCGLSGLDSCSTAVVSLPSNAGVSRVFHVLAAFPTDGRPRLSVVTFGIQYDPDQFVLQERGHCGTGEISTDAWPAPGSGTAVQ